MGEVRGDARGVNMHERRDAAAEERRRRHRTRGEGVRKKACLPSRG